MILLYHHVVPAEALPSPRQAEPYLVSPQGLENHLRTLARRGYQFVPLQALVERIRTRGREGAHEVAVSFDDGWKSSILHALPVLLRLGVPATFFVPSSLLTAKGDAEGSMNKEDLRRLLESGMAIESHSHSHTNLAALSAKRLRDEVTCSKAILEDFAQKPVNYFAYPFGSFNARVVGAVQESGYRAACSTLGPHANAAKDLFWLYRNSFTDRMNTLRDRYGLSRLLVSILSPRVESRVRKRLAEE